jgi:hypothetical protein
VVEDASAQLGPRAQFAAGLPCNSPSGGHKNRKPKTDTEKTDTKTEQTDTEKPCLKFAHEKFQTEIYTVNSGLTSK